MHHCIPENKKPIVHPQPKRCSKCGLDLERETMLLALERVEMETALTPLLTDGAIFRVRHVLQEIRKK